MTEKKPGRGNRSARRGHRWAKEDADRFRGRRVTLPPLIDAAVEREADGKPFSQALADLLKTHPTVIAHMAAIEAERTKE